MYYTGQIPRCLGERQGDRGPPRAAVGAQTRLRRLLRALQLDAARAAAGPQGSVVQLNDAAFEHVRAYAIG
eukprot:COSAG03_NODE_4048_length_1708_cov_1.527035_2_plen_71_part_00